MVFVDNLATKSKLKVAGRLLVTGSELDIPMQGFTFVLKTGCPVGQPVSNRGCPTRHFGQLLVARHEEMVAPCNRLRETLPCHRTISGHQTGDIQHLSLVKTMVLMVTIHIVPYVWQLII